LTGDQQADAQRDDDQGLADALDDDHLDERVVLAADGVQLGQQSGEIVRSAPVGLVGHGETLTSWVGRRF